MNPQQELDRLLNQFPESQLIVERAEHVPQSLVPEPYQGLLVHHHHMTIAMEEFYGSSVSVTVLQRKSEGDVYSREILLTRSDTGAVVQYGMIRFDLAYVSPEVGQQIRSEGIPLGRVLITHNVLRHIDLGAVLKILPGPALRSHFRCAEGVETYGRLATIFCDKVPALDLLEIAAPIL